MISVKVSPLKSAVSAGDSDIENDKSPEMEPTISSYYQSMYYVNAIKADEKDKVGVHVKKSDEWNVIYVSSIKLGSKFSDTKLAIGDVILTINGKACPKSVKEITLEITTCVGSLALMCAKLSDDVNLLDNPASPTSSIPKSSHRRASEPSTVSTIQRHDPQSERIIAASPRRLVSTGKPELVSDNEHPHRNSHREAGFEIEAKQLGTNKSPREYMASTHRRASEPTAPTSSKQDLPAKRAVVSRQFSPIHNVHIDASGTLNVSPEISKETKKVLDSNRFSFKPEPLGNQSKRASQRSQEESDRKAKRDARRSERLSEMSSDFRPGAYTVTSSKRPSSTKSTPSRSMSPKRDGHKEEKYAKQATRPPQSKGLSPFRHQRPQVGALRLSAPSAPGMPPIQYHNRTAEPRAPAPAPANNLPPPYRTSSPISNYSVGVPLSEDVSSVVSSVSSAFNRRDDDQQTEAGSVSIASSHFSSVRSSSIGLGGSNSDEVVIAAEVSECASDVEERIRQQILEETAGSNVLVVEGATEKDEEEKKEDLEKYKPKGVKEKLFGDSATKDVATDIGVSPDDFIRKRDFLPWTVKQSVATDLWVATVQTDQKAWEEAEDGQTLEQLRSTYTFSGMSEEEAHEAGAAMAPPIMQSFEENPICFTCKTKFAVFNRPRHCKNCGVVVCSKCCCEWSSKCLPSTYQKGKSAANVCVACDWSATNFQEALLKGDHSKAVKLYEAGNINLRNPYYPAKKKKGEEIL
jgi:hypothetical protein